MSQERTNVFSVVLNFSICPLMAFDGLFNYGYHLSREAQASVIRLLSHHSPSTYLSGLSSPVSL